MTNEINLDLIKNISHTIELRYGSKTWIVDKIVVNENLIHAQILTQGWHLSARRRANKEGSQQLLVRL